MASYCPHCGDLGGGHKTTLCPGMKLPEEKKPDINKVRDVAVEMAKDLLMHNFQPLLDDLATKKEALSVKDFAFMDFVATLKGAKVMAERFREAHINEKKKSLRVAMEDQFQERLSEIDRLELGKEDIESRRAS